MPPRKLHPWNLKKILIRRQPAKQSKQPLLTTLTKLAGPSSHTVKNTHAIKPAQANLFTKPAQANPSDQANLS